MPSLERHKGDRLEGGHPWDGILALIIHHLGDLWQGTLPNAPLKNQPPHLLNENTVPPFSSVQSLSRVWLFEAPWTAACQASLSITSSQSLLKCISIESMMPSNHLILCHPLLLLPSIFPSINVFSNESVLCIRWPKYWSFSFNISPFNGHPGLICFRMDWLDLLTVQWTLKSLLQHHSSKASILRHSAFFIVQLSHPYVLPYRMASRIENDICKASNQVIDIQQSPNEWWMRIVWFIKSQIHSLHLLDTY